MINFQEEIKRFKPSLDVDNIEDVITGIDLTDMSDLMMKLVQDASARTGGRDTAPASPGPAYGREVPDPDSYGNEI